MPSRLLLAAAVLASLVPALPGPAVARGDSLTLGMAQFPPGLHPFAISSGAKATVLGAVYRGLFAYGPDGALSCRLCTQTPTLANGGLRLAADGSEEVTLTLATGLAWADGTPLTTADLLRGLAEAHVFTGTDTTATLRDDRTILYRLPRPTADLARAIADPFPAAAETTDAADAGTRLRDSAYSRAPTTPGLWNGPYRLAEFRPDGTILLARNEHWSGVVPAFRQVEIRLIENTAALQSNLLSGDVDLPSAEVGLSFDQALALAHDHADRFSVTFAPGEGIELLAVRLDNPLLADPRVRLAMLSAIDRATIAARLFGGKQAVADSFLPPNLAPVPAAAHVAYDPARARVLLAQAGFTPGPDGILVSAAGRRLSVPLATTAGNRTRELIELVLKDQFHAVGIELTIANTTARTLFGETLRERRFEGLVLYNFGLPPGMVPFQQFDSHAIPTAANGYAGLNYPGLADPRMDAALAAAGRALEPAARQAAWQDIQARYAEDLPTLPLLATSKAIIAPLWLEGVAPPRETGMMTLWIEHWKPK